MVAIEDMDRAALLELAGQRDPVGVLSVYVDVDPTAHHDAAGIDIGNRYRHLRRHVAADGAAPGSEVPSHEAEAALKRLSPEVEQLARPSEPGRGRMLFAALGGEWLVQLHSAMPVPNRVVLGAQPFIHPLLELLDEGRPAGVALVSGAGCRLLQWRLGRLQALAQWNDDYIQAAHERAGQLGGGPPGQFHTPVREHRQARAHDRAQRFVADVGSQLSELAEQHDWEYLLLAGGQRWTSVLARRLRPGLRATVIEDQRVLTGLDHADLTQAVSRRLHEAHLQREHRIARQVHDAGLAGNAALGASEVIAALNDGRVAHLVYDPQVRYTGSVAADGTLRAGTETVPGAAGAAEPRLSERIVERALATGAEVSPVPGAAQAVLSPAGGIGAMLRW